jgi:CheY-like chemotaxis protein
MSVDLSIKKWRILFVDDDESFCKQAFDLFNDCKDEIVNIDDGDLEIITCTRPSQAFEELQKQLFDLIILDVKQNQTEDEEENEQAGRIAFDAIKASRFVPVIFYTGLPDQVRDLESPTVRIVEKTAGILEVIEEARKIFESGIPAINRGLIRLLEEVQRNYLWSFTEEYGKYHNGSLPDGATLSYLLTRRLAAFVSGAEGITQLAQNIKDWGVQMEVAEAQSKVNPLRCYIMPSLASTPRTGDIYKHDNQQGSAYLIVLSPTCDLVHGKIKQVLMASCRSLEEQQEFRSWKKELERNSDPKKIDEKLSSLKALISNNRDKRYGLRDAAFFLPAALGLPNLIVDFRDLITLKAEELDPANPKSLRRIASLDSPFAESLLSRYIQFSGRIGTPDLHIDGILHSL